MRAARHEDRRRRRGGRTAGFTLLEVLMATVLSATLLTILWGLFSVYVRLFETGPQRTEQAQLARAILQQLADDLHSAIEDSPGEGAPDAGVASGSAMPARRFGLAGSRHELRFDVLQVVAPEEAPELRGDVTDKLAGKVVRQVPELRTIFYTFQAREPAATAGSSDRSPPPESALAGPQFRPGMTRRELDYETPYVELEDSAAMRFSLASDSAEQDNIDEEASDPAAHAAATDLRPEGDSVLYVPEVIGLEFRYSDGSGLSDQWDSLQRKSLPVAIEVTLLLSSPEEVPRRPPSRDDQPAPQLDDAWALDEDLATRLDEGPQREVPHGTIYRLLVDLPRAKAHPAPRVPERLTAASRIQPAAPRGAGPLAVPGPLGIPQRPDAAPQFLLQADQWIRTGP